MKSKYAPRLLACNTLYWVAFALYMPFIVTFYKQRGISEFEIGILNAIGPLISMCIQPFWAYLSDKTGRRKTVLVCLAVASGVGIMTYLIREGFIAYVIATIIFTVFQTALLPLNDALVTDTCTREGVDFSRVRMGGTAGYAIAALLLGLVIGGREAYIFPISLVGFCVFAFSVSLLPSDSVYLEEKKKEKSSEKSAKSGSVFKTNEVFFVLFMAFLIQFGMSLFGSFQPVHIMNMGYGQNIIGLLNFLSAMSEIPVLFVINKLLDKHSPIKLMAFAGCILSLRLFVVAVGNLPVILVAQLLQGPSWMTISYSCIRLVIDYANEGMISQAQSRLAIVQAGLGAVVGNVVGGAMAGALGVPRAFIVMAVFVLVCTAGFYISYNAYKAKRINA